LGEEAWLVRILINLQKDHWRKISVRERYAQAGCDNPPTDNCNAEGPMIARATVWRALDVLPPRRRAVIVMYELEGLAVSAIAALLGISAITVRWHLSMGRRSLARALKNS
jgi:RNA polymerase sigma-70 factor (ECF subfamily)